MKIAILGNAIVDGLARVSDQTLLEHKLAKQGYHKLSPSKFFSLCGDVEIQTYESGGSAANVAYTLGKLGDSVKFLGRFGTDAAGQTFFETMVKAGVSTQTPDPTAKTMEVFVLISPDGQRTLATLGSTARMNETWVTESDVAQVDWLFIEGYLIEDQYQTVLSALEKAQRHNVNIALSLPSSPLVTECADRFCALLENHSLSLIIGDTNETAAFTEMLTNNKTAQQIFLKTPRVTTHSGNGATFYDSEGNATFEETQKIETPLDVTGSGDAFAAGFLNAFAAGKSASEALQQGHILAQKVIMQLGARLKDIS